MELYLVRHGESTWNRKDKIQGQSNPHLSEKGIKQAELLKKRLMDIPFDFVYSSPLKRAYKTAEIVVDGKYPIVKDKRLSEIHLGIWERLPAKRLYKESKEFRDWFVKTTEVTPEGGESLFEFRDRVSSFFDEIIQKNSGKNRGFIFSHSGVISIWLASLLAMDINKVWSIPVDNGSLTIIRIKNPQFLLIAFNDTCHLL
ncbi:TPA: phosphoglycerate mutase [bacterium]|nr:phosphoglycerate mutase [bacterium]